MFRFGRESRIGSERRVTVMKGPLVERLADGIIRTVNRRGVTSGTQRSLVGLGMGAGALFGAQRFAFAAQTCAPLSGGGNTCNVGTAYCATYPANDGCGYNNPTPPCSRPSLHGVAAALRLPCGRC
jgi:hypothetical protein